MATNRCRVEHSRHRTSRLPGAFAAVVVLTLVGALILAVAMSDRIAVAMSSQSDRPSTAGVALHAPILLSMVDGVGGPPPVLGVATAGANDSMTPAGGADTARSDVPAPRTQPGALPATTTRSVAPTTTAPATTTTPTTSVTTTRTATATTATTTTTTTRPPGGLDLCALPGVGFLLCH